MEGRGEKLEDIRFINRGGREGLDSEFMIKGEEVSPDSEKRFQAEGEAKVDLAGKHASCLQE